MIYTPSSHPKHRSIDFENKYQYYINSPHASDYQRVTGVIFLYIYAYMCVRMFLHEFIACVCIMRVWGCVYISVRVREGTRGYVCARGRGEMGRDEKGTMACKGRVQKKNTPVSWSVLCLIVGALKYMNIKHKNFNPHTFPSLHRMCRSDESANPSSTHSGHRGGAPNSLAGFGILHQVHQWLCLSTKSDIGNRSAKYPHKQACEDTKPHNSIATWVESIIVLNVHRSKDS